LNKAGALMRMAITSVNMFQSWRIYLHLKFMNLGYSLTDIHMDTPSASSTTQ